MNWMELKWYNDRNIEYDGITEIDGIKGKLHIVVNC